MIYIVAPYSFINRDNSEHLGAARKIETIFGIFSKLSKNIVLINSSHDEVSGAPLKIETIELNGTTVFEVTPPCFFNRKLGKFINLFQIKKIVDASLGLGVPTLLWLYNGYAFESLFAMAFRKKISCPVVFEFEDWHFSRARTFNPKPYVDYLTWRKAMPVIDVSYVVNAELARKVAHYSKPTNLLPGIVPASLASIALNNSPFAGEKSLVKIGFFGGLSSEKGVDSLLELVSRLPTGFQLIVSGSGLLDKALQEKAERFHNQLVFHGRVSDERLYELIAQCDVIVNPHRPIAAMNNGVFPFKVIEAIASGRMLISTAVPDEGLVDLLEGVLFYDGSVNELFDSIMEAPAYYKKHKEIIRVCAIAANDRFGEAALLASIDQILNYGGYTH